MRTPGGDVFRRPVERLANRAVALVRPVGGPDIVGAASQKQVELPGDRLTQDLHQDLVPKQHKPSPVGEPTLRVLLTTSGRLHNAVECELGDNNDLSHGGFSGLVGGSI